MSGVETEPFFEHGCVLEFKDNLFFNFGSKLIAGGRVLLNTFAINQNLKNEH